MTEFVIGFVLGAIGSTLVSGLILMERKPHPWWTGVRLPAVLHKQLKKEARLNAVTLRDEIINRLEHSLRGESHA